MASSFGMGVLRTAWANTQTLFTSRLRASLLAVASLGLGLATKWLATGFSNSLASNSWAALYVVATAVAVVLLRFLWQLLLAPSEIIHQEIRPVLEYGSMYGVARQPNYSIWKHRSHYNVNEFAALLVGIEPSAGSTGDFRSMQQLVLEELLSGALKGTTPYGNALQPGQLPDIGTRIAKGDALAWAEAHGFATAVAPLRQGGPTSAQAAGISAPYC